MRLASRGAGGRRIAALALCGLAAGLWGLIPSSAGGQDPVPEEDDRPVEAVGGRLRFEGAPVEGVRITVVRDDRPVGTTTTDSDGSWEIELPGPGDYEVSLDQATLPEAVTLRDPDRSTLEVTARSEQRRTLLFPLGESERARARFAGQFSQSLLNGIKLGLIIAMASVGLSLVYGTTRLVNFAHGDMVTFGAVVALFLNAAGPRLHLVPAAALAIAAGGLLGGAMERGLWRPLRVRDTGRIQLLVISIGLAMLMRHLILFQIGGRPRPYHDYTVQAPLFIGPIVTTPRDLAVIVLSSIVLGVVGLMLLRTRLGKAMRAVADNRDLASSSGVDVQRIILVVWVMAGALAALGGILLGVVENVDWLMGFRALLIMFAAVILGGLGTAFGAMAGGLVVGMVTELSTLVSPTELKFMWALVALVIVLLIRPQGIFGRRERVG